MPSSLVVPVATISWIAPHPNADSLDIVGVLGWQCIVKRGEFHVGDNVVYFPPDTVLPPHLSDELGVTPYLSKGRIKPTRLRGEPSFGLVIKAPNDVNVGDNVAERYGVSKYEPPTRVGTCIANPDALPRNPLFPEYTHIENLRHFPDLFASDELVVVTEKLHGTNSRIGIVNGEWLAGSHRVQRGPGDALYWSPKAQQGVEAMITTLAKHHKQVILYGEILGSDVQSLDYGYKGHSGYRAFDLMVDGRYLDIESLALLCFYYDVSMVPWLWSGRFDYAEIRRMADGPTALYANCEKVPHLREGVVVRPLIERTDRRVGRAIAKYVSDEFLLARQSDYAEV